MKKAGIITLTRQTSLAYAVLKKIVEDLDYQPICGEAIGADSIFFSLEELTLVGHDFLGNFFKKIGLSDADIILISAPYSVNLFILPKVVWCLRNISSAPIILGGNEVSNNYKNLMLYRFSPFVNKVVDIAPDFIVRGSAETVLPSLLPLLNQSTMTNKWGKDFINRLFEIPNLIFWLPDRKALVSTSFSSESLKEKDIFAFAKYGKKSIAVTLQRACIWAKKAKGGCLFCAIASQFGKDFHCAVQGDFFVKPLRDFLKNNPEIEYVDVWDDTFNINEDWVIKICGYLKKLSREVGREIVYSCFLRPKGLSERIIKKMRRTNFRVAFVGADALTEKLSKRLRRGCSISELNKSIELLGKGGIQPRLSVQLFSPESTVDDAGITATVAMNCIRNGESSVHVHLYTFPLYGSDIYALLEARDNLKKIPSTMLKKEKNQGFQPYRIAYDYNNYDPDLEVIKQKTYKLLDVSSSFYVKTYPGDHIDGNQLKEILKQVRQWCVEVKKYHRIKTIWYMTVLFLEDKGNGLSQHELINLFSKHEPSDQVPENLRSVYGNFGYRYTLSRSFDEVIHILVQNRWIQKNAGNTFRLSTEGAITLQSLIASGEDDQLNIGAYARIDRMQLLEMIQKGSKRL